MPIKEKFFSLLKPGSYTVGSELHSFCPTAMLPMFNLFGQYTNMLKSKSKIHMLNQYFVL